MSKQHQSINEIKSFVDLYNQSVVENEKILNYTHSFEINRALVEKIYVKQIIKKMHIY